MTHSKFLRICYASSEAYSDTDIGEYHSCIRQNCCSLLLNNDDSDSLSLVQYG